MKLKLFLLTALLFLGVQSNAQLNMSLIGQYSYPGNRGDCSDIWGYVDGTGKEYAIVGNQTGTSIMDISNPANPVEVFYTAGANSIWRDIKVWGTTAYITNESGGGMKIIDLSNLPGPITAGNVSQFTGSTYPFTTAHNLYIDEQGKGYIVGANNGVGGAIILDLNTNPLAPIELGRYDDYYVHDAFVRGDTLWGGAINDGFFVAVNVSNPSSCVTMATHLTPSTFSHNCWLSDDGNTVFTTDEVSGAYVAAYDVSNLSNITALDQVQSSPGNGVIPHNVFVKGNYLFTSYYRDGVVVHDASNPSNIVEVGNYDTSPAFSGDGFNGCWGVYPYLPSGNIIASDIENGLYVLGFNATPAAILEGNITDAVTTQPINNALAEITSIAISDNSDAVGFYSMGVANGGAYDVTFSKLGYISQTISNVTLTNGNTTVLNVQLVPQQTFTLQGQVIDENSNPIPNAQVMISNSQQTINVTTNGLGNFDIPGFLEDTYDVTIGIWGFHTLCLPGQLLDQNANPVVYQLNTGYSDFFDLDLGWTVSGTVSAGDWEKGDPVGTNYLSNESNPEDDSQDCGVQAYVTGNGGGQVGNDDVDGGTTVLTSPTFDLTAYGDPHVTFERWFFNDGGSTNPNDSLVIILSNGTQSAMIDFATDSDPNTSSWAPKDVRVQDYMTPTAFMQLKIKAMDLPGGHIVEGGFDNFVVTDAAASLDEKSGDYSLGVYPNPFANEFIINVKELEAQALQLEVIDIATGRVVVKDQVMNGSTVKMPKDTAIGMYLVRVSTDGLTAVKRIMKM